MVWNCVREFLIISFFFQKLTKTTSNNFSLSFFSSNVACTQFAQFYLKSLFFWFPGVVNRFEMYPRESMMFSIAYIQHQSFRFWLSSRWLRMTIQDIWFCDSVDVLIVQIPHTVNIQKRNQQSSIQIFVSFSVFFSIWYLKI